ncbi:phage minor capsid protein [Bacillus suaedae]|uniref:Capsid protein n=1 Tax=Halalkalibacter suaedae TaxID=2822140 RepID=A0A940WXV7_9BACI|nr:phage minor capsid protein [Bacillus suaedae]MBP3950331.1 hypothetical protein [Bacillus suaedae]
MNSNQLITYFSTVLQNIANQIGIHNNWLDDKETEKLIESILFSLDQLGVAVEEVFPEELLKAYFGGVDKGTSLLRDAGLSIPATLALNANGQIAQGFSSSYHMDAVQELIRDSLLDLRAAINRTKRSSKETIEETIQEFRTEVAKGLFVGDNNKGVTKRVIKNFFQRGFTAFRTTDGKNLPLDFYASTLTRTKMKQANVNGAVNRYKENDVYLVQINEHQPTCHVCAQLQGMVISLTGEHEGFLSVNDSGVSLPPWHPNCEHSVRPFIIRYKQEGEVEKAKGRWKGFNPAKDVRSKAQRKAYDKEQAIRRKANAEKKMYARYQMALGDEAPKTVGAFRRMKRQNTIRFQELQSQYRRTMRDVRNNGTQ